MPSRVAKWGNSLGVHIPLAIAEQVGISAGIYIKLVVVDDHILIQKKPYCLQSLLSQVNAKNIHHETESGSVVGKETW